MARFAAPPWRRAELRRDAAPRGFWGPLLSSALYLALFFDPLTAIKLARSSGQSQTAHTPCAWVKVLGKSASAHQNRIWGDFMPTW